MCMVDSADFNFEVLTDENRKAKKPHICCECGRKIEKEETYNYQAGVGDGFDTFKTCAHCVVGRDLVISKCRGFIYEEIKQELSEHTRVKEWGYTAARLYVGMNRKWKNFKNNQLMKIPSLTR